MRITLLRHGKPEFELKGNVKVRDLGMIAKSYDSSGIVGRPPNSTLSAVKESGFVVSSHLLRSVDSARALGFVGVNLSDPLFCETPIPYFDRGSITLPIGVWIVVLRVLWLVGYSKNGESLRSAKRRAKEAAMRLIRLAEEHNSVLLVGHGFINHLIAKELKRRGWLGTVNPGKGYWGYGVYERSVM